MIVFISSLLSACSQSEEDTQEYFGVISDGKAMGYEYTVTKEENSFSWRIGYKGDITTIEENTFNQDELQDFMMAVNDSKVILSTLIISSIYIIIVAITSFYIYKKNKKMRKEGWIGILLASVIAFYFAIDASFDLSMLLKDLKVGHSRLIN